MYNLYCSVRDESHNDWLITVSLFYCNITTFVTVIYYVHKVLYQLDRAHCPTRRGRVGQCKLGANKCKQHWHRMWMTELCLWTNNLLEFDTVKIFSSLLRICTMFPALMPESGTTESESNPQPLSRESNSLIITLCVVKRYSTQLFVNHYIVAKRWGKTVATFIIKVSYR